MSRLDFLNNKKMMLCLACLGLIALSGVVAAANTSTGSVNVIAAKTNITNLQMIPSAINPTELANVSFTMTDMANSLNTIFEIDLWFWHSSVSQVNSDVNRTNYYNWQDETHKNLDEFLISSPSFADFRGLTTYDYSAQVRFDAVDKAGEWNVKVSVLETGKSDTKNSTFTLNPYMSVNIAESSFSFGTVQQGQENISIQVPSSGYLSVSIATNFMGKLQASGTDPIKGTDTFSVHNVRIGDTNVVGSAKSLQTYLADINGVIYDGYSTTQIYLWINVPSGVPLGTYTFILTLILVAG